MNGCVHYCVIDSTCKTRLHSILVHRVRSLHTEPCVLVLCRSLNAWHWICCDQQRAALRQQQLLNVFPSFVHRRSQETRSMQESSTHGTTPPPSTASAADVTAPPASAAAATTADDPSSPPSSLAQNTQGYIRIEKQASAAVSLNLLLFASRVRLALQ